MATVVNNPSETRERYVERDSGSSAGWAVAIIVLLAVIAFGAYYFSHRGTSAPQNPGANINVTLPSGGSTGGTGSTSGGATGGGTPGGSAY